MNSTHHRARPEQIARVAMLEREMLPDFSADVLAEVEALRPLPHGPEGGRRDERHLPWSSIDNDDSRDLDQLTVAGALPDGRTRLRDAVAGGPGTG